MSKRKSRLAAHRVRGPFGSTSSLLADANKFRRGDDTFLTFVEKVSVEPSGLIARLDLACGHKAIMVSQDGIAIDRARVPDSIDCLRCSEVLTEGEQELLMPSSQEPLMMPNQLHNLVVNGGKVVIVGGYNKAWSSYRKYSQLEFWSGNDPAETGRIIRQHGDALPSNTRAVIISRFISHSELIKIMADARKKRIVMFPNKTDGEISRLLDDIISATSEEKPVVETLTHRPTITDVSKTEISKTVATAPIQGSMVAPKGALKGIVAQHDVTSLSPSESADALMEILRAKGIPTTLGSVKQAIWKHRRAEAPPAAPVTAPAAPKPTPPPAPIAQTAPAADAPSELVRIFDEAIAGLQLCRDAVVQTAQRNTELEKLMKQMQKVFGGG